MTIMQSIVYVSSAVKDFSEEELLDLLRDARERNARVDVTGVLVYDNGRFIQCIEGPAIVVMALFAAIRVDPRHKNVIQVVNEDIEKRDFAGWTMGYVPIDKPDFDDLLVASWPLKQGASLPASGSKGKQLLQIAWEQMLFKSKKGGNKGSSSIKG